MLRLLVVCALLVTHGSGLKSKAGVPLDDVEHRIINGVPAGPKEFPSQVSLRINGNHNCGASILSANWTLTAAHCVSDFRVSQISFLSGTNDILLGNGTVHPAAEIVIHSAYNSDILLNDIAVVRVSVSFVLDGVLRAAIKLPRQDQTTAVQSTATVIGWGILSLGAGQLSRFLQKVDLKISDQVTCKTVYQAIHPLYDIYPSQICAGVPEGLKDSCSGDSGGPLFVDGTIVGIVSWEHSCALPGIPGVYTRVASYRDWIAENKASTIRIEIAAIIFISQLIFLWFLN